MLRKDQLYPLTKIKKKNILTQHNIFNFLKYLLILHYNLIKLEIFTRKLLKNIQDKKICDLKYTLENY